MPIRSPTAHLTNILEIQKLYRLEVRTFGCGRIKDGLIPNTIQTATVKVITNRNCESLIESLTHKFEPVPDNLMCTNNSPTVNTQYVRITFSYLFIVYLIYI
jgi:hypothetical protein